jgi:hypothetical protein
MKKKMKIFILFAFLGSLLTLLPVAQAEVDYITYGDVVSAFNSPVQWSEGRIWWWEYTYYYEDAHYFSIGLLMNEEDIQTAIWYYNMDAGFLFQLYGPGYDGEFLPVLRTALKRSHYYDPPSSGEEPTYGFWYNEGVLFKPKELPLGEYTVVFWMYNYYFGIEPFIWWGLDFEIV